MAVTRAPRQQAGEWEQLSFVWAVARRIPVLTLVPDDRPQTRADCESGGWNAQRPCPFVGCPQHLYLQVHGDGRIQYNHPGLEPWENQVDFPAEDFPTALRILQVLADR